MAQQYSHSSALSDDIYTVTPQQTGVTQGDASNIRHETEQHFDASSFPENPFDNGNEKPPALPSRCLSSLTRQAPPLYPAQSLVFQRFKDHVMAYMVALPQPLGPNGQPVDVPQRYMLYLPPAPDLLKPSPSSGMKERKRDKCVRRWQAEVRKAKTHSGSVVSLSGLYCATVRGAVYCLSLIQRSELTFLSRLPRKTLQELCFVHAAGEGPAGRRRFELVKEEFQRNKHIAKRDFWIGAVVLPFAQGVDIAIPIGGGFSEVTSVWMIVTGSAWKTASGMLQRLVFQEQDVEMSDADGRTVAVTGESLHSTDNASECFDDGGGMCAANEQPENPEAGKTSRWKKAKAQKPPIETKFRSSTSLDELSHYIQAACHARNPNAFPDVGQPSTEERVLTSIGWAPDDRESEDREADAEWQIRKATEDLKIVVAKAAKTWDKFCMVSMQDPEKALRDEEKARLKRLKREEQQREKSISATEQG